MADAARRPSIRLSEDEAWAFVSEAPVGVFTTLRRDGYPIALPVWFVVQDRRILIQTRGKKLARVAHDARSSFLVERGERWVDLRAVHLTGTAELVELTPDEAERFQAARAAKYEAYTVDRTKLPEATQTAYASGFAVIVFTPDSRILSWDNRRIAPS